MQFQIYNKLCQRNQNYICTNTSHYFSCGIASEPKHCGRNRCCVNAGYSPCTHHCGPSKRRPSDLNSEQRNTDELFADELERANRITVVKKYIIREKDVERWTPSYRTFCSFKLDAEIFSMPTSTCSTVSVFQTTPTSITENHTTSNNSRRPKRRCKRHNQKLRNPFDCNSYFRCIKIEKKKYRIQKEPCNHNYAFSESLEECLPKEQVACS